MTDYTGYLEVPEKTTVLIARCVVILICSYLLLFSEAGSSFPFKIHSFILLYILSNVELYLIDEEIFTSPYFYFPLVLLDTFFLGASFIVS